LCAQEFRPAGARTPRRGAETVAAQDVAGRHRRHVVAELEELATDALVAPPRVVVGEPDDQLCDPWWNGRSSSTLAPPSRRLARNQVTMPPEQRLGTDDERRPARIGEKPAGRRQEHAVPGLKLWARSLPFEDFQLVAKHDDLKRLVP
jgi:hypothetical protein